MLQSSIGGVHSVNHDTILEAYNARIQGMQEYKEALKKYFKKHVQLVFQDFKECSKNNQQYDDVFLWKMAVVATYYDFERVHYSSGMDAKFRLAEIIDKKSLSILRKEEVLKIEWEE